MPAHRSRSHHQLLSQSLALSMATPQVVTHRLVRMARAGPVLSARDRREFEGMVWEKSAAFWESWAAMWAEGAKAGATLAAASLAAPWSATRWAEQLGAAMLSITAQGLMPVQRRATANARRLGRMR
ncbi:polyhydroxyalkanoate granule-associated phasin [Ramlibacter sp. AN1015]|uniref:polyhydroxyalkanoate granule-associated phasin n=1 Tax=Ramlibacter sp. AN1015 TaxID=3133428 RepID=UPI0030BE2C1D